MKPEMQLTPEVVTQILESYEWTFAKSYATRSPHWWTHRKTSGDFLLFRDLSRYIWHFGDSIPFYRASFPIFRANGYRYWLAGSKATDQEIDDYHLINRTLDDDDELERIVNGLGYEWTDKQKYLQATGRLNK